jgi:hypothetical protein
MPEKNKDEIVAKIYSLAKDALLLVDPECEEAGEINYALKDAYEEYRD